MTTTTIASTHATGRRTAPLVLATLAACAVAGAVLFWIGQALFPVLPNDLEKAYPLMVEHRSVLMASRLLTAAGAFLLVPAAVGFSRLVPRAHRGGRLMFAATTIFGIATASNALSQAVSGYATWTVTAPGFDADSARTVIATIESGLVALPLGFWSIPAFALGAILMAVALWRSRLFPVWLPLLLGVGTVSAAAFAGQGLIVGLTQLPVTVALVLMGMRVLERSGAPNHA